MSRRSSRRPPKTGPAGANSVQTGDSFQNFATRTGLGAGSQQDASNYAFSPVSRNQRQLEFCYRSSWIAGQAVDAYAEDMTREGIEFTGDIDPDRIEVLNEQIAHMELLEALCNNIKWARLYGGSVAVFLIDGQDVSTPLRLDTISKDQFKGFMVLDRWVVQPTLQDLITDFGPDLGKPKFYQVVADAAGLVNMKIHHSRVIRVDGVDLPYWQRISENGWGQSILERLWDRLIPFDSVTEGAAQLAYKAHLRTYKVDGLREIIAAGGKAFEGLVKQIDLIRLYQSNEGLTLMDTKDEFEAHSYSFAGLSDMMLQFGQQIAGATGIPLVRLFGQSPAGLSATGESDIRNYYDNVKKDQKKRLGSGVRKMIEIMYRSAFGEAPPAGFGFTFRSLWQMTDDQKADIAVKVTTAVTSASDAGLIDRATALKELRQSSQITGIFSNVSDEDIAEAENEPPPSVGELEGAPDEKPNAGQETEAGQPS
jgi:phage-related protein (TIGR01555 family)